MVDKDSDTAQKPPRVKISAEDAARLEARLRSMKRALLNVELNAKRFIEEVESYERLFSLLTTETEQPRS